MMAAFSITARRRGRVLFRVIVDGRLMDEANESRWAFALGALRHHNVRKLVIREWPEPSEHR